MLVGSGFKINTIFMNIEIEITSVNLKFFRKSVSYIFKSWFRKSGPRTWEPLSLFSILVDPCDLKAEKSLRGFQPLYDRHSFLLFKT